MKPILKRIMQFGDFYKNNQEWIDTAYHEYLFENGLKDSDELFWEFVEELEFKQPKEAV